MSQYSRAALFIDYENFHQSTSKRLREAGAPYAAAARIDFAAFIQALELQYGPIAPSDCIVVANFAHYDSQRGGLNRVSTLIHIDSFEARSVRSQAQSSPGKKYVVKNFADMRLALEIGRHVTANQADAYLICTGDGAFAAIGRALKEQGVAVVFILPDLETGAVLLKEEFDWVSLDDLVAQVNVLEDSSDEAEESRPAVPASRHDPVARLLAVISKYRQELSAGIPVQLVEAFLGPSRAGKIIERARSEGKIDTWTSPDGVLCISRREERMYGKMPAYPSRPELVVKAKALYTTASAAEAGVAEATQAGWRRAIKQTGDYSNNQAKQIVAALFASGILSEGALQKPDLKFNKTIQFIRTPWEV